MILSVAQFLAWLLSSFIAGYSDGVQSSALTSAQLKRTTTLKGPAVAEPSAI